MLTETRLEFLPYPSRKKGKDEPTCALGRDAFSGFTLIEIMVSVCIIGLLAAIAMPSYLRYREKARVAVAVSDLKAIETVLYNYASTNGDFPDALDQTGYGKFKDPWGNKYQYLRIEGAPNSVRGSTRKDHFLVPVNSDFDIYSKGADGASRSPFTAGVSQDDIVRAFNGAYYGKVAEM